MTERTIDAERQKTLVQSYRHAEAKLWSSLKAELPDAELRDEDVCCPGCGGTDLIDVVDVCHWRRVGGVRDGFVVLPSEAQQDGDDQHDHLECRDCGLWSVLPADVPFEWID